MLIANVENTIAMKEGRIKMKDKEKFEGFKQKMIDDNEVKYGDESVNQSNQKIKGMTEEQFIEFES